MTTGQKLVVNMPYCMLHFLIKKKILKSFVYNFKYAERRKFFAQKDFVVNQIKNNKIPITERFLICFCWEYTLEGLQFWENIFYEFKDYSKNCE